VQHDPIGNETLVRDFLAAAAAGDREAMSRLAAPDITVIEADSLPFGGRHVGLDAFTALVRTVFGALEATRLAVEQFVPGPDCVVVLATLRGRSHRDGSEVEMPIAEVWRIKDGLIREVQPYYFDVARMCEATS
jgi:hypothetical protein